MKQLAYILVFLIATVVSIQAQDEDAIIDYLVQPQEDSILLDLRNRDLTEVPSEVFDVDWATALLLGNNSIFGVRRSNDATIENTFVELPPEIANMDQLRILEIYGGSLETLPPEIGKLHSLKDLHLQSLPITELPAEIGQLQNLQVLALTDLDLEELPAEIGQLQNLRKLYLTGLDLEEIPPEIGNLTNLEILFLDDLQIRGLPDEITNLTNLRSVSINNTPIYRIPPQLYELPPLENWSFRLSSISMAEIDQFRYHQKREERRNNFILSIIAIVAVIGSFLIYRHRTRRT